jgi:dTDP-glucose 4,6-dehydratase
MTDRCLVVTGGAGFIGSNFVRHWLAGHPADRVVNYDLHTYAGDPTSLLDVEAQFGDRYRFVRGDIGDARLLADTLERERPDIVVNFAAESHNSRAVLDPNLFFRTNVMGTQTLLEAARHAKISRFHHISTCEVYGDLPLDSIEKFTEESPYRANTPYAASKASADLLVRAYHATYGLAVTISNCSNNYGPWQHLEKLIPLFATNALEGQPLPIYRQSQHRREWVHVIDHCRAIELIIERGRIGHTYNVGSGEERTIDEVADRILEFLGKSSDLKTYVADRPGHDRRYLLDHAKIEDELGWRPQVPFEVGLRETVLWYRDNPDWWSPKKRRLSRDLDEFAWKDTMPGSAQMLERRA